MSRDDVVLLAGATGLVGGDVLRQLLAQVDGPRVLATVRRPLDRASPKLVTVPLGAESEEEVPLEDQLRAASSEVDVYLCCLGTTIKKAGSPEAFLAVDRDLVLRQAALARDLGARQAILVSSVGASAQSGNFYLRVKGETERALADLGFERVDLLRPGLLLGEREESRPGETLGRVLAPLINPLMRGPLRRYRGIAATDVASAAVALLQQRAPGRYVHEYADLISLARR